MNTALKKTEPIYLRKIWAAARELGMDSDQVHLLAEAETRKDSLKHLTDEEARQVISAMLKNKIYTGELRPAWQCSQKQEWLITKIENELLRSGFFKTGSANEFRKAMMMQISGAAYRSEMKHSSKEHARQYIELLKDVQRRLKWKRKDGQ